MHHTGGTPDSRSHSDDEESGFTHDSVSRPSKDLESESDGLDHDSYFGKLENIKGTKDGVRGHLPPSPMRPSQAAAMKDLEDLPEDERRAAKKEMQ